MKIKLCGLSRPCDIEAANHLRPEYIGFVLAPKSRRYVSRETAALLKSLLRPDILAVGVFADENPETVAELLEQGIIDIAQLHGRESEDYISRLRAMTDKPLIKAFRMDGAPDLQAAKESSADFILLDSGSGGTGACFDWDRIGPMKRPYFLAGGLSPANIESALLTLTPFAVDVSSGIETDGQKDFKKMTEFVRAVRATEGKEVKL